MLNYKLQQMREAGLVDRWIAEGISSAGKLATVVSRQTRVPLALSLDDMQGIFFLYGFLISVSVLVSLLERGIHFIARCKGRTSSGEVLLYPRYINSP